MNVLRLAKSMALRLLTPRSKGWPRVERAHLLAEPVCQWCGGVTQLQVHHCVPYHVDKARELDPANLITLCMGSERCHFVRGHASNWFNWVPDVRRQCEAHRRSQR